MPFIIRSTDFASFSFTLSATQDTTNTDLYNVFLTGVLIDNGLKDGTYFQFLITHPSVLHGITNQVASISGGNGTNADPTNYTLPGYNGHASVQICTVGADTITTQNPVWNLTMQTSTDNATWASLLQIASGTTWDFVVAGVNRRFENAYQTGISVAFITASTTTTGQQSGSINFGSVTYSITGTSSSLTPGTDYLITYPEDTSIDNVNVNDTASVSIPATGTVELASGDLNIDKMVKRGGRAIYFTSLQWSNIVVKNYTVHNGIQQSPNSDTFTPASSGVTYTTAFDPVSGFDYIEVASSTAAVPVEQIDSLIVAPN
jgi:hypothetical protein